MQPIPVRFNLIFGIFLLLCAAFILGTGLFIGAPHLLVVGGLNGAVAVGVTFAPMFVVHDDRIEMRNLLGMTMRTHTYGSLAELEIRGSKIFRKEGETKALVSASFLARGSDWDRVVAVIEGASS
mgnify:CR=1 FL=1